MTVPMLRAFKNYLMTPANDRALVPADAALTVGAAFDAYYNVISTIITSKVVSI